MTTLGKWYQPPVTRPPIDASPGSGSYKSVSLLFQPKFLVRGLINCINSIFHPSNRYVIYMLSIIILLEIQNSDKCNFGSTIPDDDNFLAFLFMIGEN